MIMHYSAFLTTRSAGPEDDRAVIDALTEHAKDAVRRGFDAVFLPDHHFTGYAPPASDPMMYACYLAGQLPETYFGFSVQTVALHHPVRFAERLSLIDQLTRGKILVGLGSGTTPEEMIGLGVKFQDSRELAASNLEIADQLWAKRTADEPVSFENSRYSGDVVSRIVPAPYQGEKPQMMSVAMSPSSVERAAREGQPAFIMTFTPPVLDSTNPREHVEQSFNRYKEALLSYDHPQEVIDKALEWTTVSFQYVHVAPTDEQADEELGFLLSEYQEAVEREHAANKKAENISGVQLQDPPTANSEGWKKTWGLYGSPETVAADIRFYRDLGIGNILGGFLGGPLTPERERLSRQALDLFETEVMPLVD
jgi:alkanesulfonate monooxygenase SsuD/methylene tetrahydromethanopterin reductase-like flavin-dependent oxidoreductase (luciferase family)